MLYPDFNDLISIKNRKSSLKHLMNRSSKNLGQGGHASLFRGQGLEFDAVREYIAGDDIRNIDWRVTARTGSPHLKLFKEEREQTVLLMLDRNSGMNFGSRNTFKSVQAAHILALLGWKALKERDPVGGGVFGNVAGEMGFGIEFYSAKRTSSSFSMLLKKISEPTSDSQPTSLATLFDKLCQTAPASALIYIISDFMELPNTSEEGSLSRLIKKCNPVFISVNDPFEASLKSVGTLCFASEKEKIFIDSNDLKGQEAWEAQWKSNRKRLTEITNKYKIPLVELTTQSELPLDLISALKRFKRKGR